MVLFLAPVAVVVCKLNYSTSCCVSRSVSTPWLGSLRENLNVIRMPYVIQISMLSWTLKCTFNILKLVNYS